MDKRYFNFEIADKSIRIHFSNWILLLYYAKELDFDKFKLLFEFTFNAKSFYGYMKDMSGLICNQNFLIKDLEDSEYVLFNENKLSTTIQFITTIIENLKKEKVDLLEKYGGDTSFVNKIDNDKAFVTLFLYENEGIYYDNESNILILKLLKRDVFENSLFYKKPHKVYIDD